MARRLNFGCGAVVRPGWVNYDRYAFTTDVVVGFADDPCKLPFEDGAFDIIVANHSLCAIAHFDIPPVLAEFRRVLAAGGELRVLVPDIAAAWDAYRMRNVRWFPMPPGFDGSLDDAFCAYLTWFSENRSCFTHESLRSLLASAGFLEQTPHTTGPICELDSRKSESLIVEAIRAT